MPEIRIKTQFGDIRINYNNEEELKEQLSKLQSQIDEIQSVTSKVIPLFQRDPKPGFEYAYRFLSTGRVELLFYPDAKSKIVALLLFAYSPESVPVYEIEQITGIDNVVDSVLSQTLNRKYFRKTESGYSLTPDGIKLVYSSVPPNRSDEQEDKSE